MKNTITVTEKEIHSNFTGTMPSKEISFIDGIFPGFEQCAKDYLNGTWSLIDDTVFTVNNVKIIRTNDPHKKKPPMCEIHLGKKVFKSLFFPMCVEQIVADLKKRKGMHYDN